MAMQETVETPVATVVSRNIEQLAQSRREFEQQKSREDHIADLMTRFSGSMIFVYVHALWFGVWTTWNLGWFGLPAFDEFPFGLLTMIVSLEAIFLSTFVLVSQNRMGALADKRADLDVQTNLLAEHEITELLVLVHAVVEHLGIQTDPGEEIEELEEQVDAVSIMHEIEKQEAATAAS
jgi:uncharacterized membrane protein